MWRFVKLLAAVLILGSVGCKTAGQKRFEQEVKDMHLTPREAQQLAEAEGDAKALSEGDLKSVPSGTYICTVDRDDNGLTYVSCSDFDQNKSVWCEK
jgi:hypothetical protein